MSRLMAQFHGAQESRPVARVLPGLRYGPTPERRVEESSGTMFDRFLRHVLQRIGGVHERRLADARIAELAKRIEQLKGRSRDEQVMSLSHLRARVVARGHDSDSQLAALAHASLAAEFTLGLQPREGQYRAAIALFLGRFVEMPTGEGKTLATALAAAVTVLDGTPVHVLTANDYLAERDAMLLAPLYNALGLSCGCVLPTMEERARRTAYGCDVVHLTGKQAGFDWMRDALALGPDVGTLVSRLGTLTRPRSYEAEVPLQRGLCAAILDEADSLLIDEARTPLVLASPLKPDKEVAREGSVALALAQLLCSESDFQLHREKREATLTQVGIETLTTLAERVPGVWKSTRFRNERIRQALAALHLWERDHDYIVREGQILLVDEQTGRALPDRRLQHGLHALLELKEHCLPTPENETIASIACQCFFLRYKRLVGTSGTLSEARTELTRIYDASIVRVLPARPSRLTILPPRVFLSRADQLDALIDEVRSAAVTDRPVLVGTRSVEHSRGVSAMLTAHGINHQVLDASQDVNEATVVAEAGLTGRVTVATNMAGRGTDIPLGVGVARQGGLHLVSLAFNDARRIDRQLIGRTARQGEPGSFRQLWTLDEPDLVAVLPASVLSLTRRLLGMGERSGPAQAIAQLIVRVAQRRIEERHAAQRRIALASRERIARHVALGGHTRHPA